MYKTAAYPRNNDDDIMQYDFVPFANCFDQTNFQLIN